MMEVSKVMVKNVITVKADTHVYEAMKFLVDHEISGLPVVDNEYHLVGIISEKDMLRLLTEEIVTKEQVVAEFMSREVKFFDEADSIIDVCEFFINNPMRRVPIVGNGKLVGLVSRRDIIKLILRIRNGSEN